VQVLKKDTALQDFLSEVYVLSHSQSTVSTYRISIINKHKTGFCDFLKSRYNFNEFDLANLVKKEEMDIYKVLQEFVLFLDGANYGSNSIQLRLASTKGYLRHIGIKIYSEDFKQTVRIPKTVRQREKPLSKEIIQRLLRNVSPKLQTVILVLAASGMRIGELVQLRLSDIDFTTKPTTIRIRAETTKTRESRETFLTAEATESLKDYLRRYFKWEEELANSNLKNAFLFGRTSMASRKFDPEKINTDSHAAGNLLMKILANALKKIPELNENNENGRKVIHFHALRKFFRTTVGNVCGRDFAEALIGHRFYMDTYYQLPEEKKRQMYLDAEPYLTISDFEAVEKNIKTLSAKNNQLEEKFNDLLQYLRTNSIQIPEFS